MDPLTLIVFLAGISLLLTLVYFNSFVSKRNSAKNSFATIDVQLKLRHDLIPNLVSTVKGYAKHEQTVLTEVIRLRNTAVQQAQAHNPAQLQTEALLGQMIPQIVAMAEKYPDLKANDQFLMLQRSLNEVEAQIAAARRGYNMAVTDYNTAVQMFPGFLFANIFGFKAMGLFEAEATERTNVSVGKFT